ncbi:MAG TPA: 2-oxo acid dehydrogenase subunit E2 [Caldilineae bacterium]|nr:2-oxo acid dehydrogenase subunit E2 [Caldilineae bacterium]
MAEVITMPKMGFDMAEGTLVEWVRQVGDEVGEDDVIAIIETDKANVEVPALRSGVLRAVLVEEGQMVPVGQPIAVIGAPDEEIDLEALGVTEAAPEAEAREVEEAAAPTPPETSPAVERGRLAVSPVARRMAEELGIDLTQVRGTGPNGRIIKRDIEAYLREMEKAPEKAPPPLPTPSRAPAPEGIQVEPLTPMRRTIGRRMVESKQQAPHFYITYEIDMEAAMALRKELNALLSEDERISVNDLVIKAAAIALREFPRLNASFAGDEIHIHEQVNIGIAVAREAGLVTAVIRDCDRKSLTQIAREARELIRRVREGRMRPDDMVGSTFTISNLGMFGAEEFAAIINPPQAAILAVGAVRRVPVVTEDGELAVGTRMKVTISADHRVTDGAEAARFMQALKAALEQPLRLVL